MGTSVPYVRGGADVEVIRQSVMRDRLGQCVSRVGCEL